MKIIFALFFIGAIVDAQGSVGIDRGATSLTTRPATYSNAKGPVNENTAERAKYKITLVSRSPLRFNVTADLPVDGKTLDMDDSYPAELPEMAAKGWPALISNLSVRDAAGKEITVTPAGDKGWQFAGAMKTTLKLSYSVDFSIFAASGWSSALESAFVDENNAIVIGRSLFITTTKTVEASVEIETPNGWNPIVPWSAEGKAHNYNVRSRQDLTDNMLVFSTEEPDLVTAAGFKMCIVSMGHWRPLRPRIRQILKTIISREVALMHFKDREIYDVVLLPISDEGGEAYHQSFVYCYNDPGQNNSGVWGNTLAHEIFHYWNYARLKGASYADSQWFQEGFTEYVANLVMVNGKIIDSKAFVSKLSQHVNNYRKLTTTLENYGTHKGPPLYSAGALVAFIWDVKIRHATSGKRNIGDFFRNLMTQTDSGVLKYTWTDIKAALQATANGDWEGFYQAHIKGHEPLPLDEIFPMVGLKLSKLADGSEQVVYNSGASADAKTLWEVLITG